MVSDKQELSKPEWAKVQKTRNWESTGPIDLLDWMVGTEGFDFRPSAFAVNRSKLYSAISES
jgi:hypothetical protein